MMMIMDLTVLLRMMKSPQKMGIRQPQSTSKMIPHQSSTSPATQSTERMDDASVSATNAGVDI
jgi:hypothetical protein